MVHTIRAVEHDALLRKRLGQILGGFRLSCSCWSCRCSTKIEVESTHEGHVALVSEWSNDESHGVTKVLVTIWEASLYAFDVAVVLLPVVPELCNPLEGTDIVDLFSNEFTDDVLSMYIDDDKRIKGELCLLTELLPDEHDRVFQLALESVKVLLYSRNSSFTDGFVHIKSPMDLTSVQDAHSCMELHPLCSWSFPIVFDRLEKHASDGSGHHLLNISHPVLNISVFWVNLLHKVDFLAFRGDHCPHGVVRLELKVSYSLKDLSEMWSDIPDFFGL